MIANNQKSVKRQPGEAAGQIPTLAQIIAAPPDQWRQLAARAGITDTRYIERARTHPPLPSPPPLTKGGLGGEGRVGGGKPRRRSRPRTRRQTASTASAAFQATIGRSMAEMVERVNAPAAEPAETRTILIQAGGQLAILEVTE